jgi:hypothetical protein
MLILPGRRSGRRSSAVLLGQLFASVLGLVAAGNAGRAA